jgi:hypothetical protein
MQDLPAERFRFLPAFVEAAADAGQAVQNGIFTDI